MNDYELEFLFQEIKKKPKRKKAGKPKSINPFELMRNFSFNDVIDPQTIYEKTSNCKTEKRTKKRKVSNLNTDENKEEPLRKKQKINHIDAKKYGLGDDMDFRIFSQDTNIRSVNEKEIEDNFGELESKIDDDNGEFRRVFNISISKKDYDCLKSGTELSDSIIDFYIKILQGNYNQFCDKKVIFNSQFLPLLRKDLKRCSQRVPNVNDIRIFEKDLILIPINTGFHWILFLVFIDPKELEIFVCDSLGYGLYNYQQDIINVKNYFRERFKLENENKKLDLIIKVKKAILDLQNIHSLDCGIFLLEYINFFLNSSIKPCKKINIGIDSKKIRNEIAGIIESY